MAIDSRYVSASDLQLLLRDKDTGLPLRNGVVYFWKDSARSEPKNVFKLSGSPPNYSYTSIGSVVTLTAAGTFSDNENPANDIVPYYFPYKDTEETTDGTIERYYVEVYSEGGKTTGVLQFTREAWPPNVADASSGSQNLQNYIPNGQFKIHSDIEVDPTNLTAVPGQISQASTNLAQGGWTFDRPNTSTATDIVLFKSFGGYVSNPTASPDYYVEIQCTSPNAGDGYKDLRITFDDVNKFSSDTAQYTYAFWGESNGGSLNASLILIKNYGSGGDATEEIPLANFVITNSFSVIQKSGFVFGSNEGKTIGTDSFLQLALRLPVGAAFSVNLTNFMLTPGSVPVTDFPQTTDREFAYESITPAIPAYDNSNLYLPVRLGAQGLIYDTAEVGEIVAESNISDYVDSLSPTTNKMLADGNQYETAAFSPLGIPFLRLQTRYWSDSLGFPIYGTGDSYFLAEWISTTNQVILVNNTAGIVAATADGGVATGFTFYNAYTAIAAASGYFCKAVVIFNNTTLYVIDNEAGNVGAFAPGTASVTTQIARDGTGILAQITQVALTGSQSAGQYFTFQTSNGGVQNYYIWFRTDNVGSDPAIGGRTGILVNMHAGDTLAAETLKIRAAFNNCQATTILTTAASAITTGSYFTANSISPSGTVTEYYVWYRKDGAGTDPKPSGKIGIRVDIVSADTAVQVAQKTQIAINQKYFKVPDLRGRFLRGWNNASGNDPDALTRYSYATNIIGDAIGTLEFDENLQHTHGVNASLSNNTLVARRTTGGSEGPVAGGEFNYDTIGISVTNEYDGGSESRPVNISVNYTIRY